jgi:hypothetical protein
MKNVPKKLISRHNMQTNTLTKWEYKGKIYFKNIRRNSCRILNRIGIQNQLKSRILIRTKLFRIHNTAYNTNIPCKLLVKALFGRLNSFAREE